MFSLQSHENWKIQSLLNFKKFPFLDFKFTPSETKRIFIPIPENTFYDYVIRDDKLLLISQSPELNSTSWLSSNKDLNKRELIENTKFYNYDYDYFLHLKDTFFIVPDDIQKGIENKKNKEMVITINEAFELIKLYFIKDNDYYVSSVQSLDKSYYYLYKAAITIPEYQRLWSIVVYHHDDELTALWTSFHTRLKFILQTLDILEYIVLMKPNMNTSFEYVYYLGYLCVLATGILDNLALLLEYQYRNSIRKFKHKGEISLRVQYKKESNDFLKEIKKKNNSLTLIFEDNATKNIINFIYSLRDAVQHQEYIKTEPVRNYNLELDKAIFGIGNSISESAALFTDGTCKIVYDKIVIISDGLLDIFNKSFLRLLRRVITQLDYSKYYDDFDEPIKKKVYDRLDIHINQTWDYYNFFDIPILLEYRNDKKVSDYIKKRHLKRKIREHSLQLI